MTLPAELLARLTAPVTGRSFVGADLRGVNLADARLEHLDLTNANLDGANLERAQLRWVTLNHASLAGARLRGARAMYVDAMGVDLGTADAAHSRWEHVNFLDARLVNAVLTRSMMRSCTLERADLSGAELGDASIVYSNGDKANFSGAYLHRLETIGSTFEAAVLKTARSFFLARELVVSVLRREIAGDLPRAKLIGAVAVWPRWCYAEWKAILDQDPTYREVALEIFRRYPESGAAKALEDGWSMASERSDGLRA